MSDHTFNHFMETITRVADEISGDEQFVIPSLVQDFREKARLAERYAEEIMTKNRDLKIGIVGQVKAGKSSFLNALIFDGKNILPKAATPMTAALTKIRYAEQATAKVVFYSKRDWEVVEKAAAHFDKELQAQIEKWKRDREPARRQMEAFMLPAEPSDIEIAQMKKQILPQYNSCKELVEMAEASGDILGKLDTEEDISIDNMEWDLAQYVGAKGKYTAIVKYIELGLANDLLKDFEIIDTPGLGDPIRSRSEKTKEFLMACDAVFLLSPTSQFMSHEDVELMMETLPDESIHRAILVGSQFDTALLDDSARGVQKLTAVMRRTRDKLNEHAARVMHDSLKAKQGYVQKNVLTFLHAEMEKQLREEKSLYYTTALLYNAAKSISLGEPPSEDAAHILTQMEHRFDGMRRDADFLFDLAGINRLRTQEFTKIRQEKDAIIAERGNTFMRERLLSFQKLLNEIYMEGEQRLHTLRTVDIETLQKSLTTSREALRSMRRDIQNAFEACAADTKKYIVVIAQSIKERTATHTHIRVAEEKHVENRSDTEGILFWKKHVRWTETTYYKAANVDDVIANIHNYMKQAESDIAENLDKAIEIDKVRNQIKGIVLRAFQRTDAEFDENDIIGPLEVVLKRLTIPDFTVVDREKYQRRILERFPEARVKNEEIAALKREQTILLEQIAGDVSTALEEKADEIAHILQEQAVNFTDEIKQEIEGKIESLTTALQDRQGSIAQYEAFLTRMEAYKKELRELVRDKGTA